MSAAISLFDRDIVLDIEIKDIQIFYPYTRVSTYQKRIKFINVENIMRERSSIKYHLAPVFVLLVLAPMVAEILLGDVPFNANIIFGLILNILYYGTGAIIIREIVRRRGLSWAWIPVLAFVFGLIEEGLALHSLFNPNFPGLGDLGFYGRGFGVDWVWAFFVLGLHTVWSISTPILLTELIFPAYRQQRWLGNVGFVLNCVVFVLGIAFITFIYATYVTPDFHPSTTLLICTAVLVIAIFLLTLFIPVKVANAAAQQVEHKTPNAWMVGIITFLLGFGFLMEHEILHTSPLALLSFLWEVVLAVIAVILIRRWSAPGRDWNDTHIMALVFGTLLNYCIVGFFVSKSDLTDQIFHGILSVITIVILSILATKVHTRVTHSTVTQPDDTIQATVESH
jgi:hypothetical protein